MHRKHLPLLACPETKSPLELEVHEATADGLIVRGELTNRTGTKYPIVRGVPRFVGAEHYAGSFGFEWNRWPRVQFEDQNVGRPFEGHTTRMWETITNVPDDLVRGRTCVEFGCGPGRFLDVVRRKGGVAVGIDLSLAVEAARKNFPGDPDVLIVQGDLLRPPFRPGAFDGGYSIGVLHHTPDPPAGLAQLVGAVRDGGWVATCVYPKGEFYDYRSVARFRAWHQRLSPRFGYRPALTYSQFSAYVLSPVFRKLRKIPGMKPVLRWLHRNWIVWLDLQDPRWRVLDVFDAITPTVASTHTAEEVARWLRDAGCQDVRQTAWCSTSYAATARRSAASRAA